MTRAEIRDVLRMLLDCYPYMKKQVSDPKTMLDLWEITFAEYEATDIFKAVRYHINTSKFFPSIADIKEAIPRGQISYDDMPTVPQIDAPKTSYIADLSYWDNPLDLEPCEDCYKCPRLNKCYSKV